jgi:CHAT domain-containing protein/tetratricopeptide (TPR) repeat protein
MANLPTPSPDRRRGRTAASRSRAAAVVALLSTPWVAASGALEAPPGTEPTPVAAGAVVERELKARETHRYSVELRPGAYFQSVVEQHGVDVAQTILGPDGERVLEMDSFSANRGPDPVAFVARAGGRYVLAVQGNDDEPGSRYVLRVEAVREPTSTDRLRVDAVRATAELSRLSGTFAEGRAALDHGWRAARAWGQLGDRRMEMYAQEGIGFVHRAVLAELKEAKPALERALVIAREVSDTACEGRVLYNLAEANARLGRFAEARSHYEQALALHRAAGRRDKEGFVLMALGRMWIAAGQPQQGLDLLHQALDVYEPLGDLGGFFDPRALARLYLADAYLELSEHDLALTHYEAARPALSRQKTLLAQVVTGIGSARLGQGDLGGARSAFSEALRIWREVGVPGREAETALSIGDVHREEGDLRAAADRFQSALDVFRARADPIGEARALCRLGEIHRRLDAEAAARAAFEAALTVAPAGTLSLTACADLGLSRLALEGGQLDAARAHAEAALESVESLRASVVAPRTRAAALEAQQSVYQTLIEVRMRQHGRDPSVGHDRAALEVSERARARSLLELLAEARVEVHQGVDRSLSAQERLLGDQLNAAAKEREDALASRRGERAEALARDIADLTSQLAEVQGRIRRVSPHYAALAQPQPLDAVEIARRVLDEQTLLLEYALGEERSHLWVMSTAGTVVVALAPGGEIEAAARDLQESLTAPPGGGRPGSGAARERGPRDWTSKVAELSRLVLPPAAWTALDRERLLIVAPGALQYVPFAALQIAGAPLLGRFEVVSAPSASVVATLRGEQTSRSAATRTVAVFADPVFDRHDPRVPAGGGGRPAVGGGAGARATARGPLARLPFSRLEAAAIAALAPPGGALVATGFDASRAAAVSPELARYRLVHFATHGVLDARHPDLSGVVLSLVDRRGAPQDGFLRLHDVYNLRLRADLVTLSGCQTALGRDIGGEGLVGLTRGFMYAGARAVVASLWQVDDESTAELMKRFYRAMLKENQRPAGALRAAQLEMSRHRRWSDPFYWAGFVLQGEWR